MEENEKKGTVEPTRGETITGMEQQHARQLPETSIALLKRIDQLEQNLVSLERENRLLLGMMTASLMLNLLSTSDDEKRKQAVDELKEFFADFEPFYTELLEQGAPNPFILKTGQNLLDELAAVISGKVELRPTVDGLTRRTDRVADRWDLLDEIERLMVRYDNLSHLTLPNFWKEAMIELHKYEYLESFTHAFITIPARHLNTIIHKLLREAPCASMLQRYRRRTGAVNFSVSEEDRQAVIGAVKKYNEKLFDLVKTATGGPQDSGATTTLFTEITGDLLDQRVTDQLEKLFEKTEELYKNFNMGTALTEMRIPKTYQGITREIIDNAREMFDKGQGSYVEIAIHLLTVQLIYDLNNAVYVSKELLTIMQDIKS
ncbi:MAG: hypothetical protein ACFFD4_02840 [Candidatus Odinarchaeota archaeon]